MSVYVLTSTAWRGEIEITYNDSGLLINCDLTKAELSEAQHLWFLKRMPARIDELKALIESTKTARLTPVDLDVTFEMFWDRYNDKERSSKKKTGRIWNRMTRADQIKAYRYIFTYDACRPAGVARKYAETYLNAELWNN